MDVWWNITNCSLLACWPCFSTHTTLFLWPKEKRREKQPRAHGGSVARRFQILLLSTYQLHSSKCSWSVGLCLSLGGLLEEVLMYLCIKYNNWKRD